MSKWNDSPIFDHLTWLRTVDPLAWNCLACTLKNKWNKTAECLTGSESSFLGYFWSLAQKVSYLKCLFSCALFGCAVGSILHRDFPRCHVGFHCPTTAFWCSSEKKVKSQWKNLMTFFVYSIVKLLKTPVLLIVRLLFLSVALGHTTDTVPGLEEHVLIYNKLHFLTVRSGLLHVQASPSLWLVPANFELRLELRGSFRGQEGGRYFAVGL